MVKLLIGTVSSEPEIRFWLTNTFNGIALEARHSDDDRSQTLLEIQHGAEGRIELLIRDIHTTHLLNALGIMGGLGIVTRFLDKSLSA